MTWILDKKTVAANRNVKAQYEFVQAHRMLHANAEAKWDGVPVPGMVGNAAAPVPYPVYAEMDAQTKQVLLDPNADVLLSDLLPLSRALDIGKLVHQYRQAGSGGASTTSLSGLEPVPNDQTNYKYDGAVIPVHQAGYYREWRELAGQRSEGMDSLIDDQAGATRTVRDRMADYMLNGNASIKFRGYTGYGIKTAPNTAKATLAVDLTAAATTGEQIRNEIGRLRGIIRVDNRVLNPITLYVSPEIAENWERYFVISGQITASRTILDEVANMAGIAAVKPLSGLSGNEVIMGVLSQEFIVPLVGQAVSNVALPRQTPFSRYQFITWSAVGLEIRADVNGRTAWLYAADE